MRMKQMIDRLLIRRFKSFGDTRSILLETYPTRTYTSNDTIPLTSYTSGALYEVMLEGKKQQAGSYCDVRNAKLPPKEWHEAFNMKEYIWFDLFFCHMSTVN